MSDKLIFCMQRSMNISTVGLTRNVSVMESIVGDFLYRDQGNFESFLGGFLTSLALSYLSKELLYCAGFYSRTSNQNCMKSLI